MAARGRPPLPRGVVAFDDDDWRPPDTALIDTNVVAEALLPNEPEHAQCATVMHGLAEAGTTVVFSRLLEVELWEVIFNLALRERHPRKDLRHIRYDSRIRKRAARLLAQAQTGWDELLDTLAWQRVEIDEVASDVPQLMREYGFQSYDALHAATLLDSGCVDFITRDGGFAVLPPAVATLHTTRARLARTRVRRRRSGH